MAATTAAIGSATVSGSTSGSGMRSLSGARRTPIGIARGSNGTIHSRTPSGNVRFDLGSNTATTSVESPLSPGSTTTESVSTPMSPDLKVFVAPPKKVSTATSLEQYHPPQGTIDRSGTAGAHGHNFEVVEIRDRHGPFRQAVPCMHITVAAFACLCNFCIPGSGTLIAALSILAGADCEMESRVRAFLLNVGAALLQLITAPIVVGWIWSIIWGICFVNLARKWWVPRLADRDRTFGTLSIKL